MRTVFAGMSSWTALTWYKVTKTTFKTKNVKSKSFWMFFMKILNFESDRKICLFKEIQQKTTRSS